jgi:hypothetical protein
MNGRHDDELSIRYAATGENSEPDIWVIEGLLESTGLALSELNGL